ncbi:MAG: phosphate acyltransferase [Clostridiaceae bacterium]|nr:phosphate acyltransferase [Clostridiaceae bacterium]
MIKDLSSLTSIAIQKGQKRLAVAACADKDVLHAVAEARRQGIAQSILIGELEKTSLLLKQLGETCEDYTLIDCQNDTEAAFHAVEQVRLGHADMIMKGLLQTADLMRAVINKETGIRTGRLMSHVMAYDTPSYDKLLFLTDGGMNTFPDLSQKAEILENAASVLKALGYGRIYAACVCGAETVNPKITSTTDAQAISAMTEVWDKYNMAVYGPVGLDLAISRHACEKKRYEAEGGGMADIILVPNYEVGNGIGKAMTYFGNAKSAGVIVGAACPIVLVSRSDSFESKLLSISMASAISK